MKHYRGMLELFQVLDASYRVRPTDKAHAFVVVEGGKSVLVAQEGLSTIAVYDSGGGEIARTHDNYTALRRIREHLGDPRRRLEENPRRPPREWWRRCTAGVEESNRLYDRDADPQSVCGSLWYHKMRAADKRLIVQKAEEKKMRRLEENPKPSVVWEEIKRTWKKSHVALGRHVGGGVYSYKGVYYSTDTGEPKLVGPRENPVSLRIKEGTRVEFRPTPVSLALYSDPPPVGALGRVTSVSFGAKRRTSLPGPGGGLVYVKWDDGSFQGVSSLDLAKLPDLKSVGDEFADTLFGPAPRKGTGFQENPAGGGALALAALAVAGVAWLLLRGKPAAAAEKPPELPAVKPVPTILPPAGNTTPVPNLPQLNCQGKVFLTYKFKDTPAPVINVFRRLTFWPVGSTPDKGISVTETVWAKPSTENFFSIGAQKQPGGYLEVTPLENKFKDVESQFMSQRFLAEAWVQTTDGWCLVATSTNYEPWVKNSPLPAPPAAPPPPEPTPAPTSAPQSAALQGGGGTGVTIYLLKRLFVWTGSSWKLEDDEDAYLPPTESESGAAYQSYGAWPMFSQMGSSPPPYYYADAWAWNGAWKSLGCESNFKAKGCD